MAKISTYPIVGSPTLSDILIGTDVADSNNTKNFSIGGMLSLANDPSILTDFVPYIGATQDVNLGTFGITAGFGDFANLSINGEPISSYGQFVNMNTQSGIIINTAEPVKFTIPGILDGINIASNTTFTVDYEGVYVINLKARAVHSSGGGDAQLSFWIRKLGLNIPYSRQVYTIPNTHTQEIYYSFMMRILPTETVVLYWTTSNLNVTLASSVAGGPYPESPSSIIEIYKVAM